MKYKCFHFIFDYLPKDLSINFITCGAKVTRFFSYKSNIFSCCEGHFVNLGQEPKEITEDEYKLRKILK